MQPVKLVVLKPIFRVLLMGPFSNHKMSVSRLQSNLY
jgi:hypothetical protein